MSNDNFGTQATTINTTIDALLEIIKALSVITTYNVQVADGFTVFSEANIVIVGGGTGQDVDDGEQDYAGTGGAVGNPPRNEAFTLQVVISGWTGGVDQKPSRDTATAILTAIASWIRSHPNLPWSGAPTVGAVSNCQISTIKFAQTDEDLAADGRIATYTLGLLCRSYYLTP